MITWFIRQTVINNSFVKFDAKDSFNLNYSSNLRLYGGSYLLLNRFLMCI